MSRSANSIFTLDKKKRNMYDYYCREKLPTSPMKKRIIASVIFGFVYFFIVLTASAFA